MNIWKELAKHGRNGDTMMKKIDGDLAHVNAVEYEMSPESIKEIGSGTINPITGKKEYSLDLPSKAVESTFPSLGSISLGMTIGKAALGGFSAMGNKGDVEDLKDAAKDKYEQDLAFLQEQEDLTLKGTDIQYTAGTEATTTGTQAGLVTADRGKDFGYSQTNLVTSGGIDEKFKIQTGDIMAKYKTDMTKLFESKQLAQAEADLRHRLGAVSAEESYQSTRDSIASIPTTFLEGALGSA